MLARGDSLFTSALTLAEVLVKPLETNRPDVAHRYEEALRSAATIIPFDIEAGRTYAGIRVDRSIRAPDAIQLACASRVGADLFITNDERLSRKIVPGVQFITSLSRAFL